MSDLPDNWKAEPDYSCPKGGEHSVESCLVVSSCGGYDDYQFRCKDCGETWWEEGSDT